MTDLLRSSEHSNILIPISLTFGIIAMIICCIILITVSLTKRLHTVIHLLISNACVASIFYSIVQCNNYIYLLFITWDTSDISCRWRGYFTYVSIAAFVYSYLLQSISRLFFAVLSIKYQWLLSFKTHFKLILIKWIIVFLLPLPSLLTKDISFRAGFLCWVPMRSKLHVGYTIVVYYLIPTVAVITIYIVIYVQIKRSGNNVCIQRKTMRQRQKRDLQVLRNIMILFGIYIFAGTPTGVYILTSIELFYSIGIVCITLAITVEKLVLILLDREIRNTIKNFIIHRHCNFYLFMLKIIK
ncbi:hypothetical protein I4U23_023004 [Adineta vaga]|nr:hypothetical protein I4U23_023004 [Adineta vaga]